MPDKPRDILEEAIKDNFDPIKWHKSINEQDKEEEEYVPGEDFFPGDMRGLPHDHELYTELSIIMEKHEKYELDKVHLLYAMRAFANYWLLQEGFNEVSDEPDL